MFTHNVTPTAVKVVKELHKSGLSLRQAARKAKVSYYSAWQIIKGKQKKEVYQSQYFDFYNRHPITGFPLYEKQSEAI